MVDLARTPILSAASPVHGLTGFIRAFRAPGVGCVIGKGPTSDRRALTPPRCVTLAINQAALTGPADFAVVTDADVLTDDYLDQLLVSRLHGLILPYYPHVAFCPHRKHDLPSLVERAPQLRRLAAAGKLFAYRSDRWPRDWPGPTGPDWPRLRVRAFTAVACVALLAAAGVTSVYTAGVDGGTDYHPRFAGLQPLTNGQKSFDAQFKEFDRFQARGITITAL